MHSLIQERLEDLLTGVPPDGLDGEVSRHMENCAECRDEIAILRNHAEMLRTLRELKKKVEHLTNKP